MLLPKSRFQGTYLELMGVMIPFLKCLVDGLRHFRALRNGGPPGTALNSMLEPMTSHLYSRLEKHIIRGLLTELSVENREGGGITRP